MAEGGTIKVTFNYEEASFRNTLGVYTVDAESGRFENVEFLWKNASLKNSGGDLISGVSSVEYDVEAGAKVGFFLVQNGYGNNRLDALGDGELYFTDGYKQTGTIDGKGTKLYHLSKTGEVTYIYGDIYHTAAFGDRAKLNSDGIEHTLGYKQDDEGSFQIGFEDLSGGGDRDFDDSLFTVEIGKANIDVLNAHYETVLKDATDGFRINSKSYMSREAGHDKLLGHLGADLIEGMGGNDLLSGGGAGTEWAFAGGQWVYRPAALVLNAGIPVDEEDDALFGGSGDDVLLGGRGNDVLAGGAGADTLNAGRGDDHADGGADNDVINLEDGNDYGIGGAGDDIINAGDGDDRAHGGAGDDQLRGGDGADVLNGDAGRDKLQGGTGDDKLYGGTEADELFGDAGADVLSGGDDADRLFGGDGDDALSGDAGRDFLMGQSGNDRLSGGEGVDKLVGGTGADRLEGGAGADHLWGGEWSGDGDSDIFVLGKGSGRDMVHDFEIGVDLIDLTSFGLDFETLSTRLVDKGWSTEIVLSDDGFSDCLILKSVELEDLTADHFLF